MNAIYPYASATPYADDELAAGSDGCVKTAAAFDADILVAEDNPINQEVARMMLEMLGCRVVQAFTGIQAVEMAAKGRYDLILMDCQMPEMNGFEAARVIRKRAGNGEGGGRRPAIIAMTGNTTDEDRDRCLKNGMDDFLKKPFSMDEIQVVIGRWLPDGRESGITTGTEQSTVSVESPIDTSYLDNIISLQREGAPDILVKVIGHFISEGPATLKRLNDAVETGDTEAVRSIAHRFKSGCANLGALRLAEMCREMEMSAGSGTMTDYRKTLAGMEAEYEAVKTALNSVLQGEGK